MRRPPISAAAPWEPSSRASTAREPGLRNCCRSTAPTSSAPTSRRARCSPEASVRSTGGTAASALRRKERLGTRAAHCADAQAGNARSALLSLRGLAEIAGKIVERRLELRVVVGTDEIGPDRRRIPLFDGLRLVVLAIDRTGVAEGAAQFAFVRQNDARNLLLFGGLHHHVGRDAASLDRTAAGRVVQRRRQPQRAVTVERHYRLHRALAEALRAHDGGPLAILERASHDFGGGRGCTVDENHHRRLREDRLVGRHLVTLIIGAASAANGHHGAALEEIP